MTGTKRSKLFFKPFALLCVVALLSLVFSPLAPSLAAASQAGAVVRISPATQQLGVGQTTVVEIRADNVSGLAAADVELRFNPTVLQVVDADQAREGIQIQPGNFPSPDFVAMNTADNAGGGVRYAVTQLPPHQPVNGGGLLASISFRAINGGSSDLTFNIANLANAQGQPIASTPQGGSIVVGGGGVNPPPPPPPPPYGQPTPTRPLYPPPPQLTPLPPMGTPMPPQPGVSANRYTVQMGDTLYSIARRFGVSIWQLATTNAIPNINLIFVGQVLIIPAGGVAPAPGPAPAPAPAPAPTRYVVQAGDTLYSISRQFGVNVWELAQFNNLMNPNLIYAGQVLMIPVPAPAPAPYQ